MSQLTVVYDACVLYPAALRDLLVRLAAAKLFQAKWTNQIQDEWIDNLLLNRPELTRPTLERTRTLMNNYVRDSVVTGYEPLIETVDLPDLDDRHVLATAIHANASRIITFNLRDFPLMDTEQYGIVAQHPDQFVLNWMQTNLHTVLSVVKEQRSDLKKPPVSVDDFLGTLAEQGLVRTVEALRTAADLL